MKIYEVKDGGDCITLGIYSTEEAALAYAEREDYVEDVCELELNESTSKFLNTGVRWSRNRRLSRSALVRYQDAPEN